jgi:hypothetical protein
MKSLLLHMLVRMAYKLTGVNLSTAVAVRVRGVFLAKCELHPLRFRWIHEG